MVAAAEDTQSGARHVRNELLRGSALLGAATVANSGLGVLYTFAAARLLGPSEYGGLVALLSIVGLFGAPAGTVQLVLARAVAVGGDRAPRVIRNLLTANVALAIVWLLVSPLIDQFLRLGDPAAVRWLAPASLGVLLLPALRGVIQGLCHFGRLAALSISDVLVKVVGGLALIAAGTGASGAIAAIAAAVCLGCALTALTLGSTGRLSMTDAADSQGATLHSMLRQVGPALLLNGSLMTLTLIDTVVARHYLTADAAGAYAAAAVVGRSLFWVSTAVATVVLPLAARHHRSGEMLLGPAVALTGGLAAAGVLAFHLAPGLIMTLLFGASFGGAAPLLSLYGWAALLLAVSNVAVNYLLGRGAGWAAVTAPLAVLVFVAFVIPFHATGIQIAQALVAAALAFLVSLLPFLVRR